MISSVDLAHYRASHAKDWVSVNCGTGLEKKKIILLHWFVELWSVVYTICSHFQMSDGLSLSAPKTPGGAVPKERGRKIGHRRVDEKTGTVTYKKVGTHHIYIHVLFQHYFKPKGHVLFFANTGESTCFSAIFGLNNIYFNSQQI